MADLVDPASKAGTRAGTTDALVRIAAVVAGARGWRARGIAFGAGALSQLAFAPFFVWPAMFVTFPVLVWLIDGAMSAPKPARAAAHAAWWFGFGYFFFGLLWIGEAFLVEAEIFAWLLPFAVTLLPAGMALYWALAGAVAQRFWQVPSGGTRIVNRVSCVIALAVALSGAEWLRGHLFTGFPWNPPGVALTGSLPFMQAVGVFGIYGLTLWAVFLFALPLVLMAGAQPGETGLARRTATGLVGGPLLLAYALGSWHLAAPALPDMPGVKVRLVQPSVPQRDKWIAEKQGAIFTSHLDLSKRDASGKIDDLAGISHVIWPEAAMPFGPLRHPEALGAIGQMLPDGTYLLAGALRAEQDEATNERRAYNSLMVFGAGGSLAAMYDKVHLVPFGEYLPFQGALEAIGLQNLTRQRGGFARGPAPKPLLNIPGLPAVGPLICYEAIFPDEAVEGSERPGVLLVVTNDGWFGNSTGPYQHFHQTRLRAVEQGMTVIRAANNGISAVIDPQGRAIASLALNTRGSIDSALPTAVARPLYARFGDLIFGLNALLFVVLGRFLRY